ncbi:MAG: dialkylresorcinol condensing enzyme DarA [Capnocytophaga sp.]|nr:dialkylresorcinol condensing enzyme DarA [Capnocytophaga sp.]
MKKVLAVYFTQSGQLREILERITAPLQAVAEVTFCEIKMQKPFPFPWTEEAFFDAFPEAFLQIPSEIEPIPQSVLEQDFDLIILGYQVWYLSPSIPTTSFLKSPYGGKLLGGKPVITVSGSRNMWVMAQEKMKNLLKNCHADLVGNIALVDRHPNHVSVITIVRWMFSGRKEKQGWLPKPGVSDKDIYEASKFGETIASALQTSDYQNLQPQLVEQKAVVIKPFLVSADKKGNRIFAFWSAFIVKKKESRRRWLKVFYVYLWAAIWIIAPIVYILHLLLYPFNILKFKKQQRYYSNI